MTCTAVSVPSSSGHRPDAMAGRHEPTDAVSVPSSSGHRPDSMHEADYAPWTGLSPFFIRASAGRRIDGNAGRCALVSVPSSSGHRPDADRHHGAAGAGRVSVPSSSGHRPDRRQCTTLARRHRSQSLLHQGIGRTAPSTSLPSSAGRLSPFFIRASAGRSERTCMPSTAWSQSLLHQGIGRTHARTPGHRLLVWSQSLLHQGIGRTLLRYAWQVLALSQSLLHQGIGRTASRSAVAMCRWSQSLLHQGIGRTD